MAMENQQRYTIVLLTCRDPATDFRLPLAQELQAIGHDVSYIFLKRRPVLVNMARPQERMEFSLPSFLSYMRRTFRPRSPLLVFNSTNLAFPGLSLFLRALIGGFWCLDMHDDLLYGKTGRARTKAKIAQKMLVAGSDLLVHAAPTLKELFPSSHHLGNASTLEAVPRPVAEYSKVLVLASIDERMDFSFFATAAKSAPDLTFDIYGRISGDDPAVKAQVESLLAEAPNVTYKGGYVNSDLPDLLGRYTVTFAPYVAISPLTRYIDPLRYYHCLNSGMEVVSTAIPKAEDFGDVLHVVTKPEEVAAVVKGLSNGSIPQRNAGGSVENNNWRSRAVRLMEIVKQQRGKAA